MLPWSVIPSAGCPSPTALATSSSRRAAPSSIENSVWTWRWVNESVIELQRCDSSDVTSQLPLEDLAGGVARQLVEERHGLRHLEVRQVLAHVRPSLGLGEPGAGLLDDECREHLAELGVGHADHGGLVDLRVEVEQLLHLGGEQVLAAGDDHVVVTPIDEQVAVGVEVADVARRQQAAALLLVAAVGVALEPGAVADEDPPRHARR